MNLSNEPSISNISHNNNSYFVQTLKHLNFDKSFELIGSIPKVSVKLSNNNLHFTPTCQILIDTGASYSCMSQSLYDRVRNQIGIQTIKRLRPNPSAANAQVLKSIGETILDIIFFNQTVDIVCKVRFSIFSQLSQDLILGYEAIKHMTLDHKVNNGMKILGHTFPLVGDSEINGLILQNKKLNNGADQMVLNQITTVPHDQLKSSSMLSNGVRAVGQNNFSSPNSENYNETYVTNIDDTELEGFINTCLFSDTQESFSSHEINNLQHFNIMPGQVLLSSDWNLNGITAPVNAGSDRKLISENFVLPLLKKSDFSDSGKGKLREILIKNRPLFSSSDTDVGLYKHETVSVKLKDPDKYPPYSKPRPIPVIARNFLNEKISELELKEIIEPSPRGSSSNSPIHIVVTEKEGKKKFRLCIDYSRLNNYIHSDCYPIPHIRNLIDKVGGSNPKFFSTLDLRAGFWNIKLKEESRDLLSFSVDNKLMRPVRLPMGLNCSPGIFQRIMRTIVNPYINKFVEVYLDDVIIYSKNENDHLMHISKVFERFKESGILLNSEKCIFGKKEMKYLGFLISEKGWRPLSDRIKAIKSISTPKDQKQLKTFLGMSGFLTGSVSGLQYKLGPLHQLTGKKKIFNWTEEHDQLFEEIKSMISNSTMLNYPSEDPKRKMFLTTDSSNIGYGSVLSQLDEHGIEKPIGFHSGTFKNSSLNWDIRTKEFFSFYKSLDYFFDQLYLRQFRWRTDNQSLKYLQSNLQDRSSRKNQKIIRWLDFVNQFIYDIELIKGTSPKMSIADTLSRLINKPIEDSKISNLSTIDVTDFWCKNACTLSEFMFKQEQDSELQDYKNSKYWKNSLKRGLKIFKENNILMGKFKGTKNNLLIVPRCHEQEIISFYHLPNHVSPKNIVRKIKTKYFFPNFVQKIETFVKECIVCVALKPDRTIKKATTPTSTFNHPWASIQIDLLGPLGLTLDGNKYILSIVDQFSRFAVIKPIPDKSAKSVLNALSEVIAQYGPPLTIQSDNGKEFTNSDLAQYCEKLKISQKFGCPYRPTTQGLVEHLNKKIIRFLKTFDCKNDTWDRDLLFIAYTINNEYNRSIGTSSFNIFMGYKPLEPTYTLFPSSDNNDLKDVRDFSIATRIAKQRLAISDLYRQEFQRKKNSVNGPNDLRVGLRCLIKHERPLGECGKLFQSWKGIYIIKKKLDIDTYLVYNENDKRRTYIVYRKRIKVLGFVDKATPEEEINSGLEDGKIREPTENTEKVTKIPARTDNPANSSSDTPSEKYNLRNRERIDYRE